MHRIVKHFASPVYWRCFNALPENIQNLARTSFKTLKSDLRHPSLHLKKVGRYWSARVGLHYRAIGISVDQGLLWIWIGNHSEYDSLIREK
jgi:hypothetical protein